MAKKVRAKKGLSQSEKVQRLSMMLGDDPSLDVPIQAVYDRTRDDDARLEALMHLAHRVGRTVSF
jgi:hypothetical protein